MEKMDGFCVIRSRRKNIIDITSIVTFNYLRNKSNKYRFKNVYLCDYFVIRENLGGTIFINLYREYPYSNTILETTIEFSKSKIESIKIEVIK